MVSFPIPLLQTNICLFLIVCNCLLAKRLNIILIMVCVKLHHISRDLYCMSIQLRTPLLLTRFFRFKKYIEQNRLAGGTAIFVLPENIGDDGSFIRSLHKIIKKELFDTIKIKCVSASSLKRYLKLGANEKIPAFLIQCLMD